MALSAAFRGTKLKSVQGVLPQKVQQNTDWNFGLIKMYLESFGFRSI